MKKKLIHFATAIVLITALVTVGCSDLSILAEEAETSFSEQAVTTDAESLSELSITYAAGDEADSVTGSFTVPISGDNGTTITWTSSDTEVITIAEDGTTTVTRPSGSSRTVTLKATITKGNVTYTKTITVTVLAKDVVYHTITFLANNGSMDTAAQTIAADTSANLNSNTFTYSGHTFSGWATTSGGSVAYTDGQSFTMGSSDLTLYAVWTALPPSVHAITFIADGGSGSMSNQTIEEGATAGLNTNVFTYAGHTFSGWATTSGGPVAYSDGADYTMGSSDVTLYAVWTAITHTITFNANGGSGSMGSQTVAEGATVSLNANTFTYSGYTLAGWATTSGGPVAYSDGADYTMGSSDVTLYAVWIAITHTITFNANGGSGSMGSQTVAEGATVNLNANTFTRTGYVFAGWSTVSGGAMNYADKQEYTMGGENVSLFAVWTASNTLIAKLTFDSQDCSDTSGSGNDGIPYNLSYTSDGNGGYAASFNGSSSYIELPNSLLKNNASFTVMMRFKAEDGEKGSLLGYQNTVPGIGTTPIATEFIPIIMLCSDGRLYGELWIPGGGLQVFSTKAVDDGNWHTVYFSAKSNSIALYLDGELLGTKAGTVASLSMIYNQIGTSFGRARDPGYSTDIWYYFEGDIDNFYMYSTALH